MSQPMSAARRATTRSISARCMPLRCRNDQPMDETTPLGTGTSREAPVLDRSSRSVSVRVMRAVEQGLDAVILNPGVMGPNDRSPSRIGQTVLDFCQGPLSDAGARRLQLGRCSRRGVERDRRSHTRPARPPSTSWREKSAPSVSHRQLVEQAGGKHSPVATRDIGCSEKRGAGGRNHGALAERIRC